MLTIIYMRVSVFTIWINDNVIIRVADTEVYIH